MTATSTNANGSRVSDMEALNRRAKQRADEANQRTDELLQRYQELADRPDATPEQLQHARRAATAARSNAAEARQHLLEQLDRSAAIHQLNAHAHDQAAIVAGGHADKLGHIQAAERHRAAARRDRAKAEEQREPPQHLNVPDSQGGWTF
jgi:hypothetical protein